MKRYLVLLMLISGPLLAQDYSRQLTLHNEVTSGVISDQKATESIVAIHTVQPGGTALYTAGKSVTFQPGFLAQAGSVVTATIEVVPSALAVDRPGLSARAYPNPFVDQTTVEYTLPMGGRISHKLMDVKGKVLRQSEDAEDQSPGRHQTRIEGANLLPGVYLYQLRTGSLTRTLKLIKK
ncbi:T9SS type A sorting domain-containing protein [Larkinella rosea]|uniref:T9SS C-terminal target domain-containing protein n=1 Tax=Larkinella rosea TaxID=2025312 RepID=A0A3P1BU55_9BACT|nr:T9SS type A sorting domain-containing protein [Larkinella rosea]RRB04587.1 T9SS C-terminal target domain-containing protein [Larkinella rosea]